MQAWLTLAKIGGYCCGFDPLLKLVSGFKPPTVSLKTVLVLAILCGSIGASSLALGGTIITDQSAYQTGDTVVITGSGYIFNEPIALQVKPVDGSSGSGQTPWMVIASPTGEFATTWIVPSDYRSEERRVGKECRL